MRLIGRARRLKSLTVGEICRRIREPAGYSYDQLIDNRKGIIPKAANLLTGVKVSDVDVDKQRAIELRQTVEQMMKGHPHLSKYTNFYVKPEDVNDLSPHDIELMRMYSGIQDRAKAYAKEQRTKIGIRP